MNTLKRTLTLMIAVGLLTATASAQYVRIRDNIVIPCKNESQVMANSQASLPSSNGSNRASMEALAWYNQSVPTGGTLDPWAFGNPATINESGQIAFMARVNGADKNQGIFMADEFGLHPIAMGCGGGGGSGDPGSGAGDPTPIGGTFSGMFAGTSLAPTINNSGDVLFLSDVDGGSSIRALFLYRDATSDIVKVAAVDDPYPLGGGKTDAVGPGSLNDLGQVAFVAYKKGATNKKDYFLWEAGVITKIAAVGDPAPGGGTFLYLGTESYGFKDGTYIPAGPIPCIINTGQIAFRAIVSGGITERGLIISSGGVHEWCMKSGDPTPVGGYFYEFFAPIMNSKGGIAFYGEYEISPGNYSSGWFAGSPDNWRKAIGFDTNIEGGTPNILAVSRNPFKPLDDNGNLMVWANVNFGAYEEDYMLVSAPDGHLRVVAREGEVTPLGGSYGSMQAWPSMNKHGQGTLSSATPGAPGGVISAHFLASKIATWLDLGHALAGIYGDPELDGEGPLQAGSAGALHLANAKPFAPSYLILGFSAAYLPFKGGTVVPSIDIPPLLLFTDSEGALTLPWASWPGGVAPDSEIYAQYWIVDSAGPLGASASNALLATTP
ncbi:MAG: DUF7453 family protein [Planctomycetota bacterium]|jgi:hypothetical protein